MARKLEPSTVRVTVVAMTSKGPEGLAPTSAEHAWLDAQERAVWLSLTGIIFRLPAALDAQLQRDAGLNYFEYLVLAILSEQPREVLQMSELARITSASLSRLSHVAKRLELAGFMRREQDIIDGRCTNAVLTRAGRKKVVDAAPHHVAEVRRLVFDGLTQAQLRQLGRVNDMVLDRVAPGGLGEPFTHR